MKPLRDKLRYTEFNTYQTLASLGYMNDQFSVSIEPNRLMDYYMSNFSQRHSVMELVCNTMNTLSDSCRRCINELPTLLILRFYRYYLYYKIHTNILNGKN